MKKILVPVDFSEVSENAFRFALELARKSHGQVLVLHVLNTPTIYDPVSLPLGSMELQVQIEKEMREQAMENFKNLSAKWSKEGDFISFIEDYGNTTYTIKETALHSQVDLMVMGARQVKGLDEFLFGSHSGDMVKHTSIPTFFIKSYFDPILIKSIIFPNSLELNQDDLVQRIKELQEFFVAEIKVLYINTPYSFRSDNETHMALKKFADHYHLQNYSLHVFSDRDEESGIAHFMKSFPEALIAMSTHGRFGLHAFLDGSITKNLVDHFDYPIWAILKK